MRLFNYSKAFWAEKSGAIAVVFGLGALPIFGLTTLAVDYGRQSLVTAEIGQWVSEACDRVRSGFFAGQPMSERIGAADAVLRSRVAQNTSTLPDDFNFAVSEQAGGVHIDASGTVNAAGVIFSGDWQIAFDVNCDGAASGGGPGSLIFAETFENPQVNPGWSWQVFASYPDWLVDGYGPQIIIGGVDGLHPASYEGAQYVELDSNWFAGGDGLDESQGSPLPNAGQARLLNSSIARVVYLNAGTYELTFVTRRKLFFLPISNEYDIGVYFEPAASGAFSSTPIAVTGNETNWTVHRQTLVVAAPGDYRIAFRALGRATKFGGLLDDISLRRL